MDTNCVLRKNTCKEREEKSAQANTEAFNVQQLADWILNENFSYALRIYTKEQLVLYGAHSRRNEGLFCCCFFTPTV